MLNLCILAKIFCYTTWSIILICTNIAAGANLVSLLATIRNLSSTEFGGSFRAHRICYVAFAFFSATCMNLNEDLVQIQMILPVFYISEVSKISFLSPLGVSTFLFDCSIKR